MEHKALDLPHRGIIRPYGRGCPKKETVGCAQADMQKIRKGRSEPIRIYENLQARGEIYCQKDKEIGYLQQIL